ncbi:hypothetical protein AWV79_13345 [Cupriavidus sp. UYMMa02A]|nr:hypothetical protein AWV79_13345 [Cupriavidus sp. UYMMa02A]
MSTSTPSSLTYSVYQNLRAELLNGRLVPGEKLKPADLSEALSVSLGAVREALSRLTAEGLVIAEPQRGFRVAPIGADELLDITNVRIEIESLCLKRAIAVGDTEWESGIVSALHRLTHTPKQAAPGERVSQEWATAHTAFHAALVAACDSPWLLRIREVLYVQSERYRWFSIPPSTGKRNLDKEHRKLADAVIGRDEAAACKLMTEHLQITAEYSLTMDAKR